MRIGYVRVSTKEQNEARQISSMEESGVEKIYIDKQSGKDLDRPGYQALKGALGLRSGDTLYIKSLDRLSRNKADIKKALAEEAVQCAAVCEKYLETFGGINGDKK